MALTPAQRATLKTDALATPSLTTAISLADWPAVAAYYNAQASPDFTVWKTNVSIGAVGDKMNAAELAGLTTLNVQRLQVIAAYSPSGVNPSLADRRAFFDDVFSGAGGVNTRASLLALWKRLSNRVEKLFATGTGSDAVPATMTFEGGVTNLDVQQAMQ